MKKNIAVGYARYSTDMQTENSIAYQTEHIEKYCADNNLELLKVYTDEGTSGTNIQRPAFSNLLIDAKNHLFSTVIIYDITRGSRDVGDWFTFRKTMLNLGIKVVSLSQKLGDITDSADFLTELISVGMGHSEVLANRKKSIDGTAVKAKQGAFLGGSPPLGYNVENGKYTVCDEEAQTVKLIFSMYANGKSYGEMLTALKGKTGKYGRPFGKNSFLSILKNERYIGIYTWNKRRFKILRKWAGGDINPDIVRIENALPKIIDDTTWEEVQKRLNAKSNGANKAKRTYLLAGLVKCGKCGATYIGHTSKNAKGYEHKSYICGNKYRTRSCDAKNINADEIETFVAVNLKEYFNDVNLDGVAEKVANALKNMSANTENEKKELAEIERKIQNGVNAILAGVQIEELQNELEKLKMRKSELEELIQTAEKQNPKNVTKQEVKAMLEKEKAQLSENTLTKEAVRRTVSEIIVNPDGTYTVSVGVHIANCTGRQ